MGIRNVCGPGRQLRGVKAWAVQACITTSLIHKTFINSQSQCNPTSVILTPLLWEGRWKQKCCWRFVGQLAWSASDKGRNKGSHAWLSKAEGKSQLPKVVLWPLNAQCGMPSPSEWVNRWIFFSKKCLKCRLCRHWGRLHMKKKGGFKRKLPSYRRLPMNIGNLKISLRSLSIMALVRTHKSMVFGDILK